MMRKTHRGSPTMRLVVGSSQPPLRRRRLLPLILGLATIRDATAATIKATVNAAWIGLPRPLNPLGFTLWRRNHIQATTTLLAGTTTTSLYYRDRDTIEEQLTTSTTTADLGSGSGTTPTTSRKQQQQQQHEQKRRKQPNQRAPTGLSQVTVLDQSRQHVATAETISSTKTDSSTTTATTPRRRSHSDQRVKMNHDDVDAINRSMISNIAMSQLLTLLVATVIAVVTTHGNLASLSSWYAWIANPDSATATVVASTAQPISSILSLVMSAGLVQSLAYGIAAATPMIAASQRLDNSSRRDVSRVQFATTDLVIRLFGRRRQQLQTQPLQQKRPLQQAQSLWQLNSQHHHALNDDDVSMQKQSMVETSKASIQDDEMPSTLSRVAFSWITALAVMSAICEEMVFRLYIPASLFAWTHSMPAALLGQSILFGVSHWHGSTSSSHPDDAAENRLVVGMQSLFGLWHGLVYVATGGDLLVTIISHALYNGHVLASRWDQVNDQMDYTERCCERPYSVGEQASLDQIVHEVRHDVDDIVMHETAALCRRFFYAFDSDRVGTLSLDDVQRATSYAFLQQQDPMTSIVPPPADVRHLFHAMLEHRHDHHHHHHHDGSAAAMKAPVTATNHDDKRLDFPEFVRVLFTLQSHAYHHHHP